MKRYFSGMTAQQAPRPRIARQALVSLPGTIQTAFAMPHCTKLTQAFASRKISSSEMMPRGSTRTDWRAAIATTRAAQLRRGAAGAGGKSGMSVIAVIAQRSTSAMRALYQFMKKLMPRLMVRNTAMISAIASIAWPVWFSVVLAIETMS